MLLLLLLWVALPPVSPLVGNDSRGLLSAVDVSSVYSVLTPCLRNNPIVEADPRTLLLAFPSDAHEHYAELLRVTERFRKYPHHEFGGYRGPWIEALFIERFISRPLEFFKGMFPIFVQWIENDHATRGTYNTLFDDLKRVLRRNVIYVIVSQANEGVYQLIDDFPNILMLSSGGFGHIPLPLIKGDLARLDLPQYFSIDIGFFGDVTHGGRTELFAELDRWTSDFIVRKGKSSHWVEDMGKTKFNLAPAGFGPTSFRLAEIIQLERLPVYLYFDRQWLPYEGTDIAVEKLGYVGSVQNIRDLVQTLRNSSDNIIQEKLKSVKAARRYYTYGGLLEQIELFFNDPLNKTGGGGYLRCTRVPLLHTWPFWWNDIKKRYFHPYFGLKKVS